MTTTWTITIDWDRNGNYSDTYDDVTDRVVKANWFLVGANSIYLYNAEN